MTYLFVKAIHAELALDSYFYEMEDEDESDLATWRMQYTFSHSVESLGVDVP